MRLASLAGAHLIAGVMRKGGNVEKLIVPVYLNQKLVFDLLAMLQDGISTVKAINSTSGEATSQN